MASIYLTLKSFAVDCHKLYINSDKDNLPALSYRIASVALRGVGAIGMLSFAGDAFLLNKRGNAQFFSALSDLTYALFMTIIGHEIFAIGSSLSEKASRENLELTQNNITTAGKNLYKHIVSGDLTASITDLLKHTWELKHIYADNSKAINKLFADS